MHSPTLSDPSTSTSRKRYRPSSRGRRRKRCPSSSSSRSSSSYSDPASQPSSSSTPGSRSTTANPRKRSRYSSFTPSPKKRERTSRKKHASSNKRSHGRLRKQKHRHHQTSSRSLPVSQKLSKSIVRGEFIEFPKLLAEHMAMSGVLKKPKSGHKPEPRGITGLDTWLEAWCVFASVLMAAKPRLAPELFRYQNYNIILASWRFQPHAWLQYDIQFRLKKASNPSMSWTTSDPELTATWLSADAILPKISCYLCGSPDHLALVCPTNTAGKSAGLRCPVCSGDGHTARSCSTLASTSHKQQKFPPPGGRKTIPDNKICCIFNQKGSCFRGTRCPYFHVCNKCKGGHLEQACPDHTYSLLYSTIDDAIKICHEVGKGALLAMVDLKNAFRLCPVRPDEWHLLGICWCGQFYIDKCLSFGLRLAPFLFNMVADSLEWILQYHFHQQYCFHYLDDISLQGRHKRTLAWWPSWTWYSSVAK